MSRRHHQDEIGNHLVIGNAHPSYFRIGDQGRDVVVRVRSPVGGERVEIVAQPDHGEAYGLCRHLGHLPGRVFRADKTVRQTQQRRVIGFRNAQHARNDAERERRGDVGGKIADAVTLGDPVHHFGGPVAQPFLQRPEGRRRERGLQDRAISRMVRLVHLGQPAHDLRLAGDLPKNGLGDFAGQIGAWRRRELLASKFDRQDVGMPGDCPERPNTGRVHPMHRRQPAQYSASPVQARLIGMPPRRYQRGNGPIERSGVASDLTFGAWRRHGLVLRSRNYRR